MKRTSFFVLVFLLFTSTDLFSQVVHWKTNKEYKIQGIITDKDTKEALIGVNIFVEKDKMKGTVTDFDGKYELAVNEGDVVVFRYIGYKDQTFTITNSQEMNIELTVESTELNGVVVSASRKKEKILDAPASISTVESAAIQSKAALNVSDHLKNVPGVQIMRSGILGGTPSVRGFNGYMTTDVMSLTDNRVAKLPNTGLNQYQMMSTGDDDIDRIEILKGPSAALYGPNANNGVIHIITKSPLDFQETKFFVSIGARSRIKDTIVMRDTLTPRFDDTALVKRGILSFGIFHSDTIFLKNPKIKMGYKISAKYFGAKDWKYDDPGDPGEITIFKASSDSIYYLMPDGSIDPKGKGKPIKNERNERIQNGTFDGRMDIRIKDVFNIVVNGGVAVTNGIISSPIGAVQNKNWTYFYQQTRFMWKDLFAQFYFNGNNSHDSYFVPVGGEWIDNSKMYAMQIQHSYLFLKRINLVYGFDAFWNRPDTKGTLNGKNENKDNIDEYGLYLQGDYKIHPRFNIVFASRIDYNTVNKKVIFSPKLALTYKPGTGHNLRFTFNRAFKTPGSAAYFVDVKQGVIPQDIEIRNEGTPRDGFHYSFANNPYYDGAMLPQFRSPYGTTPNTYYSVNDGSFNNAAWAGLIGAIKGQFLSQFGIDASSPVVGLINQLINKLAPATIPDSIQQVVKNLNTTTRSFDLNNSWQNTKDIPGLKPSLTYTYELGYKGVIGKIWGISIDAYRTDFRDFIAPVTMLTPTVQFNSEQLLSVVGPQILTNYNKPQNFIYKFLLDALLDNNASLGGNNNGTGSDELLALFQKAVDNLPIGVITPMESDGPDMLLVTRNIGDVTLYGIDVSSSLYIRKNLVLSANYSWMSKDSIPVESATMGYVAVNSPRHKVNIGLNYTIEKIGLTMGTRFQWNAGFPVSSGNYIGHQKATHDMDLDISYTPKFWDDHFNITVSVQNLYARKQQYFIGSPVFGTTGVVRLSYIL